MQWSYRLFRVLGISIELHLTFLLFFFFIFFGLGFQAFLFFLLIFTVVLAHELVHSLTALAHGIKVPKITLLPIGGLASIELPEDPVLEVKVSIVGPLFNFMLAGIGLVILTASSLQYIGYETVVEGVYAGSFGLGSMSGILSVIISINFILGAFNMLPAFPMDGGRVFRGVLAFWMDYAKATRIATLIGQFIFLTLAFLGLLLGNIWWILIGVFLSYAGSSEMKYVNLKRVVGDLRLKDIAVRDLNYVNTSVSWKKFMDLIYRNGLRHYLMVDSDGVLRGVLDVSEVQKAQADEPVGKQEGVEYTVLDGGLRVSDALKSLLSKNFVLIQENGKIIGYVTSETLSYSTVYMRLEDR